MLPPANALFLPNAQGFYGGTYPATIRRFRWMVAAIYLDLNLMYEWQLVCL